jgi:hypothetical protein
MDDKYGRAINLGAAVARIRLQPSLGTLADTLIEILGQGEDVRDKGTLLRLFLVGYEEQLQDRAQKVATP